MKFFSRLTILLLLAAACAPSDKADKAERVGQQSLPILGGANSPASEDYSVRVYQSRGASCSGTLVAANIVVTARHCILQDPPNVNCSQDGVPVSQSNLAETTAAVYVTLSPYDQSIVDPAALAALAIANVKQMISSAGPSICVDDYAFLILDRDLSLPVARLRFDQAWTDSNEFKIGAKVKIIGYGQDVTGNYPVRQFLDGVPIEDIGPGHVPARSFSIGIHTACLGDSGGGAFLDGNLLVGVQSRFTGIDCFSSSNILARASGTADFRRVAEQAFKAGGKPQSWLLPTGAACAAPSECVTNLCQGVCLQPCSAANMMCPMGTSCNTMQNACIPLAGPDAGTGGPGNDSCDVAPGHGSRIGLSAAVLATLVGCGWARSRRRRAVSRLGSNRDRR
jgi:hypothetical protein